jgi:hypothetical protein
MTYDPHELINGHLDCTLSEDEQQALNDWIKVDPGNADRFVSAVMLHNRVHLHYQSLQAILDHLDSVRITSVPRASTSMKSRRLVIGASVACLLLASYFYFRVPAGPHRAVTAIAEFHDLMTVARKPGDRTYRVTFVRDRSDAPDRDAPNPVNAKQLNDPTRDADATLYVRDGRQFVYTWTTADGRRKFIGSNGQKSWTYRVGERLQENGDPLHFTGGLPGGNYLAPILSFFEGQEKLLIADYNLEVRHSAKAESVFLAAKKPDTKQGDRRIEITFSNASGLISKMRIWPETPDHHKKMNFTLIELTSAETLPSDWFSPDPHVQQNLGMIKGVDGAAD